MKHIRQSALIGLLLSLLVVLSLGCGGTPSNVPGKLTGTVKLDGAPVTGGMIYIHTNTGTVQGPISTSGSYTITDLPVGEWKVTVDTEGMNPDAKKKPEGVYQKKGMSPTPKGAHSGELSGGGGAYVPIPAQYRDAKTTPLSVEVIVGSKTYNPELTK